MDKLREERKELVVKEKEERGRLEDKFINLIKERGKRIAFYFIEQFQNFKKKQKKKGTLQNFFAKKFEFRRKKLMVTFFNNMVIF